MNGEAMEGEQDAERQTDGPVAEKAGEHGDAGETHAAQGTGEDDLCGVEDGKECGESEQWRNQSDDGRVVGVDHGQRARNGEKQGGRADHEADAQRECKHSGAASPGGIARAQCVADRNCRRRGNAKGHHVGHCAVIERNLVRGEGVRADAASQDIGDGKRTNFQQELKGDGQAKPQELANLAEAWWGPVREERVAAAALVVPGKAEKQERHENARQDGGQRGAAHAHGGQAELAVDEHVVGAPVRQVGKDKGERDDTDLADGLQVAARGGVEQQGKRSPEQNAQIAGGRCDELRLDAKMAGACGQREEQRHEQGRSSERDVDALREPAMAAVEIAFSVAASDDGIETEQETEAEQRGSVIECVAKGDGTDGSRAEAANHDDVDDALEHPAKFCECDGEGKPHHDGQLRQVGRKLCPEGRQRWPMRWRVGLGHVWMVPARGQPTGR